MQVLGRKLDHPLWEELQPLIDQGIVIRKEAAVLPWLRKSSVWKLDIMDTCISARDAAILRYGYAIPSPFLLAFIKEFVGERPIVEMGAGMGYWAYLLMQWGVWVDAFDEEPWPVPFHFWHPVQEGLPPVLVHYPGHVLFLCWPTFMDNWAYQALRSYTGDKLIVVADISCCADTAFYEELEAYWDLQRSGSNFTWGIVNDQYFFYTRKHSLSI